MQVALAGSYRSFGESFSCELPDLTILTGINGAGKTQLLYGIIDGRIKLTINNTTINPSTDCKYFMPHSLVPNSHHTSVSSKELNSSISASYKHYEHTIRPHANGHNVHQPIEHLFDKNRLKTIQEIAKEANKNWLQLDEEDFQMHYPVTDDYIDLFNRNFSFLFKRYQERFELNLFNEYLNKEKGVTEVTYLTDSEFKAKYGPEPWIIANEIMQSANLGYRISTPKKWRRNDSFEAKLINQENGVEINFNELSSGEKVLMSLALALYNSKHEQEFPKVLLFDEPDASLHPSMTKQFLDVLKNVFVERLGLEVIMTTHSPSTVALALEGSLYVINKVAPRIAKTSKEKALRILTEGVPSLSINYENRRQVFVESKHDVFLYEIIYNKLKSKLEDEISLNFIAAGTGDDGGCERVKEVVQKLSNYGNKTVFGIIDWDGKNSKNGFIKVIGEGKRYSIENYIFDPVLIAAYLLREKHISRGELGLDANTNVTDFKSLTALQLQAIGDFIIGKLRSQIDTMNETICKVSYLNNVELAFPQWYLQCQGHDLEAKIKEVFPVLKAIRDNVGLKKEIVKKVIDDLPEFIPIDFFNIYKEIQQH